MNLLIISFQVPLHGIDQAVNVEKVLRVEHHDVAAHRASVSDGNGVGYAGAEADLSLPEGSWLVFVQKVCNPDKKAAIDGMDLDIYNTCFEKRIV